MHAKCKLVYKSVSSCMIYHALSCNFMHACLNIFSCMPVSNCTWTSLLVVDLDFLQIMSCMWMFMHVVGPEHAWPCVFETILDNYSQSCSGIRVARDCITAATVASCCTTAVETLHTQVQRTNLGYLLDHFIIDLRTNDCNYKIVELPKVAEFMVKVSTPSLPLSTASQLPSSTSSLDHNPKSVYYWSQKSSITF